VVLSPPVRDLSSFHDSLLTFNFLSVLLTNSRVDKIIFPLRNLRRSVSQKRNLKTPIKTRTLHLSEPYDS
jgi:hypothetical protein